jgi:hypothetical protein
MKLHRSSFPVAKTNKIWTGIIRVIFNKTKLVGTHKKPEEHCFTWQAQGS